MTGTITISLGFIGSLLIKLWFLIDSFKTPARLIFSPQTIAITCLELGVFFFEEEKSGSMPATDPSWIQEVFLTSSCPCWFAVFILSSFSAGISH
jgi:hypothetical protein